IIHQSQSGAGRIEDAAAQSIATVAALGNRRVVAAPGHADGQVVGNNVVAKGQDAAIENAAPFVATIVRAVTYGLAGFDGQIGNRYNGARIDLEHSAEVVTAHGQLVGAEADDAQVVGTYYLAG